MKSVGADGAAKTAVADFMPFIPRARVRRSAVQALGAAGWTTISFDTEDYDTDSIHDLVTNPSRLTVKTAGLYAISGVALLAGTTANGGYDTRILKNGVPVGALGGGARGDSGPTASFKGLDMEFLELAVGDYIELQVYPSSAINAFADTRLSMIYIGPGFQAVRQRPVTMPYVTVAQFAALTPIDGDEVILIADAANGVMWHFRYNAGSASALKWEFIGGPPMTAWVDTSESHAYAADQNQFVDLATVGPQVLAPRGGDYRSIASAQMLHSNPGTVRFGALPSVTVGNGVESTVATSTATNNVTAQNEHFGLTTGQAIKTVYGNANTAGTISAKGRHIAVWPVRIS